LLFRGDNIKLTKCDDLRFGVSVGQTIWGFGGGQNIRHLSNGLAFDVGQMV
jgi:hypothetical protein